MDDMYEHSIDFFIQQYAGKFKPHCLVNDHYHGSSNGVYIINIVWPEIVCEYRYVYSWPQNLGGKLTLFPAME